MMNALETENTELMGRILHGGHYIQTRLYKRAPHRILFLLLKYGSMTQRELLNFRGIRSASLSEIISKMEDNGLILREKCELDRRKVQISLADKGKEEAWRFVEEHKKIAEELFSALSTEEKNLLRDTMDKLILFWEGNCQEDKSNEPEKK